MKLTVPLVFVIDSCPRPQPRHQAGKGRGRKAGKTVMYLPEDGHVAHWKNIVNLTARRVFAGIDPCDFPVRVDAYFLLPRPGNLESPDPGRLWAELPPDRDNLDKSLLDAMKYVAYDDDRRVVDGRVTKMWAAEGEDPGAAVRIALAGTPTPDDWWEGLL